MHMHINKPHPKATLYCPPRDMLLSGESRRTGSTAPQSLQLSTYAAWEPPTPLVAHSDFHEMAASIQLHDHQAQALNSLIQSTPYPMPILQAGPA